MDESKSSESKMPKGCRWKLASNRRTHLRAGKKNTEWGLDTVGSHSAFKPARTLYNRETGAYVQTFMVESIKCFEREGSVARSESLEGVE